MITDMYMYVFGKKRLSTQECMFTREEDEKEHASDSKIYSGERNMKGTVLLPKLNNPDQF